MIRVAIVDDDNLMAKGIKKFIAEFGAKNNEEFDVKIFSDGFDFIVKYKCNFDIVFMDIDMPTMNGLDTARKLRDVDKSVILIFMTRLSQFAVNGYEVDAMDYIIKPVNYANFSYRLQKAVGKVKKNTNKLLRIVTKSSSRVVDIKEILYIEVLAHKLIYHTFGGDFEARGSLSEFEKMLTAHGFSRCNNCYLVNLRYIEKIVDNDIFIGSERLKISGNRKTEFLSDFSNYISGQLC